MGCLVCAIEKYQTYRVDVCVYELECDHFFTTICRFFVKLLLVAYNHSIGNDDSKAAAPGSKALIRIRRTNDCPGRTQRLTLIPSIQHVQVDDEVVGWQYSMYPQLHYRYVQHRSNSLVDPSRNTISPEPRREPQPLRAHGEVAYEVPDERDDLDDRGEEGEEGTLELVFDLIVSNVRWEWRDVLGRKCD